MRPDDTRPFHRRNDAEVERGTDCDDIGELLSVYADGESTPDETAMVETHLAVCAFCARDLAFLQQTSRVLTRVAEVEPPATLRAAIFAATLHRPTFAERIAAALRRAFAPAPVRYGIVAAAGAAAAITFVVLRDGQSVLIHPTERQPAPPPIIAEAPPPENRQRPLPPEATPRRRLQIVGHPPVKKPVGTPLRLAQASRPAPARPTTALRPISVKRRLADREKRPLLARTERRPTELRNKPSAPSANPSVTAPIPMPEAAPPVVENAMATAMTPMTGTESATPAPILAPAAPAITRIQLTAAARTINAGQVASLADLKRSLRQQSSEWNLPELRTGSDRKTIRIDVLRGRF